MLWKIIDKSGKLRGVSGSLKLMLEMAAAIRKTTPCVVISN